MADIPGADRRELRALAGRDRRRCPRAADDRPACDRRLRSGGARGCWRCCQNGLAPVLTHRAQRSLGARRPGRRPATADGSEPRRPRRHRAARAGRAPGDGRWPGDPWLVSGWREGPDEAQGKGSRDQRRERHDKAHDGRTGARTGAPRHPDPRRPPHPLRLDASPRVPPAGGRGDERLLLQPAWVGGLWTRIQRGEHPRLGSRADARCARRCRLARRRRPRRPGSPRRHRRLVRWLSDDLDRRPRRPVRRRDDLSLGQRHGHPDADWRHQQRLLGVVRVPNDAVGRPGVLPRDLADHLRRPDPDATAHPAQRERHPDDGRPGRGAVHRSPLEEAAGSAPACPRGDPRADPLRDAIPAGREPRGRSGLVPSLPGRRQTRVATGAEDPRRPLTGRYWACRNHDPARANLRRPITKPKPAAKPSKAIGAASVGGSAAGTVSVAGGAPDPEPDPAAETTTVAVIAEWILQWYVNVPAAASVTDFDDPAPIVPVSNAPLSAVAVWLTESLFVHVMVSPTLTVIVPGEKANPAMSTACPAATATEPR